MTDEKPITLAIEKYAVEPETEKTLIELFQPFLNKAEEWKKEADLIQVTDASQTLIMKSAMELRLKLKSSRGEIEKTRKRIKEDTVKKAQAIDGVSNFLKGLIEPIEAHLQAQEDFVEIQETNRKIALETKRKEELEPIFTGSLGAWNLKEMPDTDFQQLVEGIKAANKKRADDAETERLAALKKAEDDRIQREKELKELTDLKEANAKKDKEIEESRTALAETKKEVEAAKEEIAELQKEPEAKQLDWDEIRTPVTRSFEPTGFSGFSSGLPWREEDLQKPDHSIPPSPSKLEQTNEEILHWLQTNHAEPQYSIYAKAYTSVQVVEIIQDFLETYKS